MMTRMLSSQRRQPDLLDEGSAKGTRPWVYMMVNLAVPDQEPAKRWYFIVHDMFSGIAMAFNRQEFSCKHVKCVVWAGFSCTRLQVTMSHDRVKSQVMD